MIYETMLELIAQIREKTGNQVKSLRRQGFLPVILYGYKRQNSGTPLQVSYRDFEKILKEAGESTVVRVKIKKSENDADVEEKDILIYGVASDPITGDFLHADFYEVNMSEEIEASVPLVFIGESPAVKTLSGTLVKSIQDVQVKALPRDLPRQIEINVDSLATFDDKVHIKDLSISGKVEILADPDEVVVLVMPPRKEEEVVAPTEEGAVGEETAEGKKEAEKEEEKSEEE